LPGGPLPVPPLIESEPDENVPQKVGENRGTEFTARSHNGELNADPPRKRRPGAAATATGSDDGSARALNERTDNRDQSLRQGRSGLAARRTDPVRCPVCGRVTLRTHRIQKYCSERCRRRDEWARRALRAAAEGRSVRQARYRGQGRTGEPVEFQSDSSALQDQKAGSTFSQR
jgi:hypothetical protein